MENEVKILRLATGEDIICSFLKIEKNTYLVIDPMSLIIKFKGGESTVLMQHWLPVEVISSNEVVLQDRDILCYLEPNDSMKEYYNNLSDKLREEIRKKKLFNDMDIEDQMDILLAMEEIKEQSIH